MVTAADPKDKRQEGSISLLRIAIVGISYESLVRSPVTNPGLQVHRGVDMLGDRLWIIRGVEQRLADEADVQLVPLLWANSGPGGALERAGYDALRTETVDLLAEHGPFDGVVLVSHGAMEVAGLSGHPDSNYVEAIRGVIGDAVPIVMALDLHGHLPHELLQRIDGVAVLRTAPHRDDRETGYRAADQLMKILRTGVRQKLAAVRIPILLPGEKAVTTHNPAKALYASLPELDALPGMIEANILVGFAWNDLPWGGMTAVAASSQSVEQAASVATALADEIWQRRAEFILTQEHCDPLEGLALAATIGQRQLFLSDAGDNTTAGAPGDLTTILEAVIDRPELLDVVVTGITAPTVVALCRAVAPGTTITLPLAVDHVSAPDTGRMVEAIVEAHGESLLPDAAQLHGRVGAAWARVRIGHVIATFHAASIGITTPSHFRSLGIDPAAHRIYVVKLGYLHPMLDEVCRRHIILLTDGAANLDVTRLTYQATPRPAFPIDSDAIWSSDGKAYTSAF